LRLGNKYVYYIFRDSDFDRFFHKKPIKIAIPKKQFYAIACRLPEVTFINNWLSDDFF